VPRRAAGRRMGSRARSVSLVRSGGPATRSCLPATRGHRTLSERARKVDGGATRGECSLLEMQRAVDGGATGGECRAIRRWWTHVCVRCGPRRPRDMKNGDTYIRAAHDLCTARITLG
jgi:hypothetical protein